MIDIIRGLLSTLRNWIVKVIHGVMNFLKHIVEWFKNLPLDKNKHTPFIASPDLIAKLKGAPVKDCGIFKGVLNEETREIEFSEEVKADALDAKTRDILGNGELVVLS